MVIASGSTPVIPPLEGLADARPWTNREAIAATYAPESLLVIGGGAIGLELAQAFARFGSQVTVIEAADRVLLPEEPESSAAIAKVLQDEGIELLGRAAGHPGAAGRRPRHGRSLENGTTVR